MSKIKDSLQLHGPLTLTTAEQVREHWQAFAAQQIALLGGFQNRPAAVALVETSTHVTAYVSDNRWVADCPECGGGLAVSPGMPDGCCYDCGRTFLADFPAAGTLADAVTVLEYRPPQNRHWRPEHETVADLQAENALRGWPFAT